MTCPLPWALVLALLLPPLATGEILSISDSGYPYIRLMDGSGGGFVDWGGERFALRIASSQAVRINSRGLRFIPPGSSALVLADGRRREGTHAHHGAGFHHLPVGHPDLDTKWEVYDCLLATDSLCHLMVAEGHNGHNFTTRIFPTHGVPAYVSHGDIGAAAAERPPPFVTEECPEAHAGRAVTFDARWDVSLCNVLGAGSDFVYLPFKGELYVLRNPISFQMFAVVSVLVIFLSIVLAHNLEYALGSAQTNSSTTLALAGMLSLLFCATFATGRADVFEPYVTMEDRIAFGTIFVYVLYYVARIVGSTLFGYDEMSSPVNPILATLVLVSLRLYTTLDNPYTVILSFLIAVRLLNKLSFLSMRPCSAFHRDRPSHGSIVKKIRGLVFRADESPQQQGDKYPWRTTDAFADAGLLSTIMYVGVVPQHNGQASVSALFLVQGFYAAVALNRVILMFDVRRKEWGAPTPLHDSGGGQ